MALEDSAKFSGYDRHILDTRYGVYVFQPTCTSYYYPLYHRNAQYLTGRLIFREIYRLNYLRSRMDVLSNRIIASVGWPK